MRRNTFSLAAVLFFALFMMTGCVISPRRTLGGSATPTPTPTATPTPTPAGTPTPTPVVPTNRLYVSNQNTNSIAVFTNGLTATGNIAPAATIVGGATTLNGPQYLAFDSGHDRLFVANVANGTILIFDSVSKLTGNANAAPTRTIGGTVSGLVSPSDVAYDATHDALYVLDATDVLVYNTISSSTKTGDIAPDRSINTSFLTLTAICLDVINDRLYVADSGSNAIGIYDNVSSLTGVVPTSRTVGGASTKLAHPFGVALDPSKNLVVSNAAGAGSITVYSAASVATGTSPLNVPPVATITGAATTLATPAQIILNTVSTGGEMIVADSAAGEVATFTNVSSSGGNTAPTRRIVGSATTLTLTGQPTARGVALDTTAR